MHSQLKKVSDDIIRDDAECAKRLSDENTDFANQLLTIKRFIGNNDEEFRGLLTSTIRDLQVLLTSESHAKKFGQYAVSKFNDKFDKLLQQLTASGESLNPIQNHAASSKQEVESKKDALKSSSLPLLLGSSLLGGAGGTMILGGVMASEYCGAAGCLAVCGAWSSNVLLVMLFSNILLRQRAFWRIGWSFIFCGCSHRGTGWWRNRETLGRQKTSANARQAE